MPLPTTKTRGTSQTTSNSSSHAITIPSHVAGDLIIVVAGFDGNPTVTAPAPWVRVFHDVSGTSGRLAIFALVATGSSHTLTLTSSASEQTRALTWVYTAGSHTVTSPSSDIPVGAATKTSGLSSIDVNPVTGLMADRDYIAIVAYSGNTGASGDSIPSTSPSGWSNFRRNAATTSTNGTVAAAELQVLGGLTSADPPAVSMSDDNVAIGVTFAIPGTSNGPISGPLNRWTGNGLPDNTVVSTTNLNTAGNGDSIDLSQNLASGLVTTVGDGVRFDGSPGDAATRLIAVLPDTMTGVVTQIVFTAPEYPAVNWVPINISDTNGTLIAALVHRTTGRLALGDSTGTIVSGTDSDPLVPGHKYIIDFGIERNGSAKYKVRGLTLPSFFFEYLDTAVYAANLEPKRVYFGRSGSTIDVSFVMEHLSWQGLVLETDPIESLYIPDSVTPPGPLGPVMLLGGSLLTDAGFEVFFSSERVKQIIWDNVVYYEELAAFSFYQGFESIANTAGLSSIGWVAVEGTFLLDTQSLLTGVNCINIRNTFISTSSGSATRELSGFVVGETYMLSVQSQSSSTAYFGIDGIGTKTISGSSIVNDSYEFVATSETHKILLGVSGPNPWSTYNAYFDELSITRVEN